MSELHKKLLGILTKEFNGDISHQLDSKTTKKILNSMYKAYELGSNDKEG